MSGPLKLRDPETLRLPLEAAVQCMRCGFCLAACPTYQVTGLETQSPRGRIHLVRSAAEGWLDPAAILPALDLCIGCRACEPACPAGSPTARSWRRAGRSWSPGGPAPGWKGLPGGLFSGASWAAPGGSA